ncbi:class II aldolase/adducin family protein [bacterium]|nr:class II aldolase/adducin family protein [bacterium]RQV97764.1 MAG: class II aldolase/adducin family protein [bacterium]
MYANNSEWELKRLILDVGKRIWTRGYVAANDGNITIRIGDNEILTTPTGVSKGFMTPDMIIKMNMDGKVISQSPKFRPSSEVKMHIEVYRQREDIKAVVHAHPPYCTSFAVAGIPLNKCVLPEAILTLGAVPIAPYGTPSTMEIPDSIKPIIQNSDAVLLANHGALTLGTDLINAYHRMETLEHSAQIVFTAIQLGNVNMIPGEQVKKLMELREKMNIPGRVSVCGVEPKNIKESVTPDQIEVITQEVIAKIKDLQKK